MSQLSGPSHAEPHASAGKELLGSKFVGLGEDVVAEGAPGEVLKGETFQASDVH